MTSTAPDGNTGQVPISFADPVNRYSYGYGAGFGIWSCRFSADGNEVVAGGSGKIFGQYCRAYVVALILTTPISI